MKVLLDHNMAAQIGALLAGHEVFTAREMLWDLLENGDLLGAAEEHNFNVMVTGDKSIFYQQNNRLRKIALVVLSRNDWPSVERRAEAIRAAVARASPGSYEVVPIPNQRKGIRAVE